MPLRKLNHLVGLVEAGSFAKAAVALHLSQPALSRSIDALEVELGVPLVDRSYGRVRLTASGRLVLERARRLQREMRELRRDIALVEKGAIGQVRVGIGPFSAATLLQPVLTRLVREHPQLHIDIDVRDDVFEMLAHLQAERTDLFIADTRDLPRDADLRVQSLPAVPVAFMAASRHVLAKAGTIALDRLLDHPVAAPRMPPTVLRHFDTQLTRRDRGLCSIVCNDLATLCTLALTAGAVILAPWSGSSMPAGLVQLKVRQPVPLRTRYGVVTLAQRRLSPAAQAFIGAAQQVAKDT
jgi:DNA-binding transcriptional LysR family regulator